LADENNVSVTIINKEHGDGARNCSVTIATPKGSDWAQVEMISLQVPHGDVAATAGITLGRASIEKGGTWNGAWRSLPAPSRRREVRINVPAASAVVVSFGKRRSGTRESGPSGSRHNGF